MFAPSRIPEVKGKYPWKIAGVLHAVLLRLFA
jgi:hypothetical protein